MDASASVPENASIYVKELTGKAGVNSREILWQNRWAEVDASPLVGVGIGVDTFGIVKSEYGTVVVEPGSSYLAVLSMTGVLGSVSTLLLIFSAIIKFLGKWDTIPEDIRTEVFAVGAFWAVHAVAEGWIFAVGSILCLFFWLWIGQVVSLGSLTFKGSTA
jgi:O-antigen ligase